MIPNRYVSGTDFHKLTGAEARAFVVFELKELVRHRDDIKRIQADVRNVCKVHGIEGIALNALYTTVYGANQSSGGIDEGLDEYRRNKRIHSSLR